MTKKKGITKVLSCFLVFVILISAIPFSVLASNSSDNVMGDALDSLSEVDTHKDIVVSGVDNATNEAAYDLSDSNITGNISNSSNVVLTHEGITARKYADVVSAKSSTYQTITVLVEYPDGSTITPDTILILYDNSWNEVKRADTNGYTRYTFTDLDVGTYHVEAYKDNMFIGSAGNIIVGAGEGKFVTIKTFSKRNLDVTVYYNDGSTPIKGATVKVYSWDGYNEKWKDEYEETTNSQGKVTFSSWPTTCSGEKYKLVVDHNGYSKTKEPVFVNKDSGSSYIITTDEPKEKAFYIRPACQDVDRNHLDDVSYEFVDYSAYKGTCDYNEYLIAPSHGSYKVEFTKGDLEATVTLESHLKTFAGTVVTLRKTEKSDIIVIVKDHDDNAVTPDTAILYDSGWHEIERLNPTSNAYTFTDLNAGTYHTEAYKDNMFIGSAENIDLPAGVCQLVTITTLPKRNLEVAVYYNDGSTPIKGATVKVYSWDGYNKRWDYEYKGTTNSQGKVTFSSWPTTCSGEKYKLVVEHNGYTKTKKPVYVDRDKGGSYEVRLDEPLPEKDVDYSALIRCISSETDFYKTCYDTAFNATWWKKRADKELEEVLNSLIESSTKSAAEQLMTLAGLKELHKFKGLLGRVGYAVEVIRVAHLIENFIHGIQHKDISIVIAYSKSAEIRNLRDLIKNGRELIDALENDDVSQVESLLEKRADIIRNTYAYLPEFDENVAYYLKHPEKIPEFRIRSVRWPIEPSYEYYLVHNSIAALHFQLQRDYSVTISVLNNLNPERKANIFLHREFPEGPEGKIKPQVLGGSLESIRGYGCLDYKGDIDEFELTVNDSGETLLIVVAPFAESLECQVDQNVTVELKQGKNLIAGGDGKLEVKPIAKGTYDIYIKSKEGSRVYSFIITGEDGEISFLPGRHWPLSMNLRPSWDNYREYPKPNNYVKDVNKKAVSQGEEIILTVKVKNDGGTASWQSIAVSSPDILKTDSYKVLSHNLDYFEKYDIGYEAGSNYGTETKKLEYPLIEGAKNDWTVL